MISPEAYSEKEVRELYEHHKLSVPEIAAKLGCKPSALRWKMKRWKIGMRSRSEAMRIKRAKDTDRSVHIPKDDLRHLYEDLGISTAEIAEKYSCSISSVHNRLHQYGIALLLPGRARVDISKQELETLYVEQGLSLRQIAKQHGCDHTTITNKLKEYGLRRRTYAEANLVYSKRDFGGNPVDKAYLVGFRLGDLYVTKMGKTGQTIVVECATTKQEQLDLITGLFSPYGHVHIGDQKRKGDIGITCYLNMSFAFLLPKEDIVPKWIQTSDATSTAFAAGYIDAEGSFFISNGSARFAVSSYDQGIIHWLYHWMSNAGIQCPRPRIVGKKGMLRPNGSVYREDVWTLSVSRKGSLRRLIELLEPYLKHAKRCRDIQKAKSNIDRRNARI